MSPVVGGPRPVPSFAHATYEIARKEFLQLLRTKRLLGIGIAMVLTMVLLTFVLPFAFFDIADLATEFAEEGGVDIAIQNFILLFFLSGVFILSGYFMIQLLPILLTADAVCSEWQQRQIFLVLSKPVPRAAFVLGKFLGIAVPLAVFTALLLLVDYLVLVVAAPGVPDAEAWGRFFGALGILLLGVLAFGAFSLFFSTLSRSSVASLLMTILSWILILPLMGSIQFFIDLSREGPQEAFRDTTRWSEFLNPAGLMGSASDVLVPSEVGGFFAFFGGGGSSPVWWASCIGLLTHTLVWLFLAMIVVQARNFE